MEKIKHKGNSQTWTIGVLIDKNYHFVNNSEKKIYTFYDLVALHETQD